MASITLNGKTITARDGANVSMRNGKVFIDGKEVEGGLSGDVHVHWQGPIGDLQVEGPLTCGDINGDVDVTGPITCRNIMGSVDAVGPVNCGDVTGNVKAMGPVMRK